MDGWIGRGLNDVANSSMTPERDPFPLVTSIATTTTRQATDTAPPPPSLLLPLLKAISYQGDAWQDLVHPQAQQTRLCGARDIPRTLQHRLQDHDIHTQKERQWDFYGGGCFVFILFFLFWLWQTSGCFG